MFLIHGPKNTAEGLSQMGRRFKQIERKVVAEAERPLFPQADS